MEVRSRQHQRLQQRFSNESGIQEDDPLQASENLKKLASLLVNRSEEELPSSVADTSFYNERCESTLFGSTSVDGSSLNLSSSDNNTQIMPTTPINSSSNDSLSESNNSNSTITGISYDDEDKSFSSSDCLTVSSLTESSSNGSTGKIAELDGDFRVDTPPPNPVFKKPVHKGCKIFF